MPYRSRRAWSCWRILSGIWREPCGENGGGNSMKTVAKCIRKHPDVKARMFERNYKKESGSGKLEVVCGFCLASRYFRGKLPQDCEFCAAPFQDARTISTLPEILRHRWRAIALLGLSPRL